MMDDFLTTHEVLDILKVDRITVYRMLQDGRIKGQKVGQQWRFPRTEIERLTGNSLPVPEPTLPANDASGFPTHCVQTIQDLFSEVGQVSAPAVFARSCCKARPGGQPARLRGKNLPGHPASAAAIFPAMLASNTSARRF